MLRANMKSEEVVETADGLTGNNDENKICSK